MKTDMPQSDIQKAASILGSAKTPKKAAAARANNAKRWADAKRAKKGKNK